MVMESLHLLGINFKKSEDINEDRFIFLRFQQLLPEKECDFQLMMYVNAYVFRFLSKIL